MLQGLNEILPDELSKRHEILDKAKSCFQKFGCHRITTPTFEPYDALCQGWGDFLKEESIKFFNHEGVLMTLRPEMTSAIARLLSSRKEQISLPFKLYYVENVFRHHHILRKQEFLQLGMEYLGENSLNADLETVRVLIELLLARGIRDFRVELGHRENTQDRSPQEIHALLHRQLHQISELPPVGGPEILTGSGYLQQFHQSWQKKYPKFVGYLQYNLGLVKEMSYYTGLIFNIYVEGVGYMVGAGGRYDSLYKDYGWDIPAVGFALELDKLMAAFEVHK
jgi:ATP phosphoribosyltransferase regulatory subunit